MTFRTFGYWHAAMMGALAVIFTAGALPAEAQRGGGAASVFTSPVQETEFSMHIEALGTLEARESRITSYNVCYTKLLRGSTASSATVVRPPDRNASSAGVSRARLA